MSYDRGNNGQANVFVSIPLEQGNVLRRSVWCAITSCSEVSIPLEQGNVLRHHLLMLLALLLRSQSLWNRAMSYDPAEIFNMLNTKSQSLWNRAMSYDTV